jgi:hypothetical protein
VSTLAIHFCEVPEHWPGFRERAEQLGGLPKFVVDEFEEYLRCGLLEHGCLLLECRACGYSELCAFSCKKRGFGPSCLGRRMADLGAHLERSVLPRVPVRHWICTFPWGLRALFGYDRKLCAEVTAAFVQELSGLLRRKAKRLLGLRSVTEAHTGAVAAVQRTDSAVRLNVHLHILCLDGVYVRDGSTGELAFHALPSLTRADVTQVARRTAERIERLLKARGRSLDPELCADAPDELDLDQPGLASCYAAAAQGLSVSGQRAGQPTLRLIVPRNPPPGKQTPDADQPVAEVRGVNVHAKQLVSGYDRKQLEPLARYITRPPVAQERIEVRGDGRIELTLKTIWKDGTPALIFEPDHLIARLVAAIPPPNWHLVRYFGILSSHSRLRRNVVPHPPDSPDAYRPPPAEGDQLGLFDREGNDDVPAARRHRWSWLLKRVFATELDSCPQCGGSMRWAEIATKPSDITRLMTQQGLAARPPPAPLPLPVPEQLSLLFR